MGKFSTLTELIHLYIDKKKHKYEKKMLLNLKNKHIILNKRHYIYKKQLVIRKKITLKKAGNAHNYCSPALLSYQYLFFIYVYIY